MVETSTGQATTPNGAAPSFWDTEPIPGVIDAFLLGWKLVELRSRVGIAGAITKEMQAGLDRDGMKRADQELGDRIWMTSIWHGTFRQIAATHAREFPSVPTAGTLYEPPNGKDGWQRALPYLYPAPAGGNTPDQGNVQTTVDYTAIGVPPDDSSGAAIKDVFSIYDVSRRALNTLVILHARSQASLIETTITDYQTSLYRLMKAQGFLSDTVPKPISAEDGKVPAPDAANEAGKDDERARYNAIDRLTVAVQEMLDDWGSFLREQYYAGITNRGDPDQVQISGQDAGQERAPGNEAAQASAYRQAATKLQAFEAGRNLARLTWSISAETIGMEVSERSEARSTRLLGGAADAGAVNPPPVVPGTNDPQGAERADAARAILAKWQTVFNPYAVIQAQHFVTGLCGAMDDSYSGGPGNSASGNGSDAVGALYDPNLPSSMGTAITRCLDHWQAAVAWLARPELSQLPIAFYRDLRVALIEESDVWQSLLTGRRRLGLFTVETVMSRLVQDALGQIQDELGEEVMETTEKEVESGVRAWAHLLGPATPFIVAAIVLAIVLAVITLWFALSHPEQSNGAWAALSIGSLGAWAAALLGLRGTTTGSQSGTSAQLPGATTGSSMLMTRVSDAISLIQASVTSSFDAAYAQLRRELAGLNNSIGVSYPLVEIFVLHNEPDDRTHGFNEIQDDFSFMSTVIWTRAERRQEIEDVVRAALGPAGLLSGAALRKHSKKTA